MPFDDHELIPIDIGLGRRSGTVSARIAMLRRRGPGSRSMTLIESHRTATFVAVPCPCGRSLRAKSELIGSEIQCWSCHQMVVVPCPRQAGQAGRAFREGIRVATRNATLGRIFGSSILITLALSVPGVGLGMAVVALTIVGLFLLGPTLASASQGDQVAEPVAANREWRTKAIALLGTFMMAAGTVAALWGLDANHGRPPHWTGTNGVVFAATWLVFPVLALMVFGRDRRGRLGIRQGAMVVIRHPFLTLLALGIMPLALIVGEAVLVGITLRQNLFAFFVLDLMPNLGDAEVYGGVPMYNSIDFRNHPTDRFFRDYWMGLGRGYTLTGVLPPSLSLPTTNNLNSQCIYATPPVYVAIRAVCSGVMVAVFLAGATLQAAWFGALAAVDHRRISA